MLDTTNPCSTTHFETLSSSWRAYDVWLRSNVMEGASMINKLHLISMMFRRKLAELFIATGRCLKGQEPAWEWKHHTFFKGEFANLDYHFAPFSARDIARICFAYSEKIDRLTVFKSNYGICRVRTLGQRFTTIEIASFTRYKPVGIVLEFEEAGIIYGRCRWNVEEGVGECDELNLDTLQGVVG